MGRRYEWAQRSLNARQNAITSLMAEVAPATGGQFIHNANDFDSAIGGVTTVPEASYILGISPKAEPDGKYHTLKVRLKKPGDRIDSRAGYYNTPPSKKPESGQDTLDRVASRKNPTPISRPRCKSSVPFVAIINSPSASILRWMPRRSRS